MATLHIQTPIGWLRIAGTASAIREVRRVDTPGPDTEPVPPLLRACARQLEEYFQRTRKAFELPLDYGDAPPFHQRVWDALRQIPYGQTTSYLAIARQLGDPKAVRAVGQANRANPIAIIIPCHRVIAANGDLQGYFYGLDVKRQLLELENPRSFARQGSLFE